MAYVITDSMRDCLGHPILGEEFELRLEFGLAVDVPEGSYVHLGHVILNPGQAALNVDVKSYPFDREVTINFLLADRDVERDHLDHMSDDELAGVIFSKGVAETYGKYFEGQPTTDILSPVLVGQTIERPYYDLKYVVSGKPSNHSVWEQSGPSSN